MTIVADFGDNLSPFSATVWTGLYAFTFTTHVLVLHWATWNFDFDGSEDVRIRIIARKP